jgi:hypothetical protein
VPACPLIFIHVTSRAAAEPHLQICPDIPDKLTFPLPFVRLSALSGLTLKSLGKNVQHSQLGFIADSLPSAVMQASLPKKGRSFPFRNGCRNV